MTGIACAITLGLLSSAAGLRIASTAPQESPSVATYGSPSWLSSCSSIYLDVGSNIGVQVRKFYEPEKYPKSPYLPVFTEKFGAPGARRAPGKTSGMCALGFEPHPNHRERLEKLEAAYQAKGWHVHFYPYAVFDREGNMTFVTDLGGHKDWSARLSANGSVKGTAVSVRTIDFSHFVQTLPPHSVKFMKMDVEGAEWKIMPRMAQDKTICDDVIPHFYVEVHPADDWQKHPADFNGESWSKVMSTAHCAHGVAHMDTSNAIDALKAFNCAHGVAHMDTSNAIDAWQDWAAKAQEGNAGLDDETYVDDVDDKFGA